MILTINGKTVDVGDARTGDRLTAIDPDKNNPRYILIQAKGPLSKKEKGELESLGVDILELVGPDVYLCHFEPDDISGIQAKGYVAGISLYSEDFKITKNLQKSIDLGAQEKTVRVSLHSFAESWSLAEAVVQVADALGDPTARDKFDVDAENGTVTMRIPTSKIPHLTKSDLVKVVEEVVPKALYNDCARQILGFSDWAPELFTGPLQELPFLGEGQIVAVNDTGLDTGDLSTMHPAFNGRVKALIPVWGNTTEDFNGHGTHVAGSIAGVPVPTSSPEYQRVEGTAPAAQLVVQSMWYSGGLKVPEGQNLKKMLLDPYVNHGARVSSNSWGDQWTGAQIVYGSESSIVDQCVVENPDLLICMAAGNTGNQREGGTVGSIAACKNVLTIGATDSTRPSLQGKILRDVSTENDPTEISYFSARGPTLEQRIKPDVLAPGTTILSAMSSSARQSKDGVISNQEFEASTDSNYAYCTGTSMATPLVAGCAAVLREYLIKIGVAEPPAALVKALLINGAYMMHHAHGAKEGFGLVNIVNSLVPTDSPQGGFRIGEPFDDINQVHHVTTTVAPVKPPSQPSDTISRVTPPARAGVTLKVTLVYNDAPGEKLQNNLNLQIKTSEGRTRNGNRGSSKWFDNYNNVEQITWKGVKPGEVIISVLCQSLTTKTQDYALVWRVIPTNE